MTLWRGTPLELGQFAKEAALRTTLRLHPEMPPLFAALVTITGICVAAPREASAQIIERFSLRGEAGGGTVFPSYQTTTLGFGPVVQGSGRLGFTIIGPVAIQASFSSWFFPSAGGNGQQYSVLGGIRIEPMIGRVGRLFVDANAGGGFSGSLTRVAFDAGLGFEFRLTDAIGLGPVFRYGRLFASSSQDSPNDANYWSAGLSLSLRIPEAHVAPVVAPPAPVDRDHDGVLDPDDLCPDEPAGDHPDPAHRGCPVRDRDHDGVADGDDACVDVPVGEHPDPARAGCPLLDSDHDGVFDPQDQCPTTPAGDHADPERAGCPDGDDDADHVLNHADQCRAEPVGLHPDPARPGCPLPDRDHDSVPDPTDACVDQPGAPSPDPRRNGCPGLVRVDNRAIHINRPVFFATNRDRILPRSRAVLQAVTDALRAMPEIQHVSIEGHTDDVGDEAANMDLSQRRANSVMQWLIAHGIAASRLEAHGMGETHPLVPGHVEADRAQNRRVEFNIIEATIAAPTTVAPTPSGSPR